MLYRNCEVPMDKPQSKQRESRWIWLILLVIILSASAIRFRLLNVPLERDEGEYAYAGQLILQGIPPYKLAYNMKLPGIYAAYAALLAVFGQTHTAVHLGLLIVNAATVLLIYLLARRLFGTLVALASAAAFALLSLGQHVQGIFANAEHFVILPAVAGILLLLLAIEKNKHLLLFFAAVLLGIAFIMKQHGIAFVLFAAVYLLCCELRARPLAPKTSAVRLLLFAVGVLLPFALACLLLYRAGVFDKFWFWMFDYARKYVARVPLAVVPTILKVRLMPVLTSAVLLWLLLPVGLLRLFRNKDAARHRLFIVTFLLFSLFAVSLGLYFRPHYFILLLPAASILAALGFAALCDFLNRDRPPKNALAVTALVGLVIAGYTLYQQNTLFFRATPFDASRSIYGANPFPEAIEIGRYIARHSKPNDRIAVLGSEPQIYFYAQRLSATGYIYMYDLMAAHEYALQMQREMIEQIETYNPEFIVLVNPAIKTSWKATSDSPGLLGSWIEDYVKENYVVVGLVDIFSMSETEYVWGAALVNYTPKSGTLIHILRRKSP